MIYLKWITGGWRYDSGIITARFDNGATVEIPIGRARRGAFFITRIGEYEWRIAPVRCPRNRPESYDGDGQFNDYIHLSGGSDDTNAAIDKI